MNVPKHDPEEADRLSQALELDSPYTIEGFRTEIKRLDRQVARLHNAIRLARTLSTEPRVQTTLDEALEVR